jgi:hypothetical protein
MCECNTLIKKTLWLLLLLPGLFNESKLHAQGSTDINLRNTIITDTIKGGTKQSAVNKLGSRIYGMVTLNPSKYDEKLIRNKSTSDFSPYNGLIIKNIRFVRLDPFGTSLMVPEDSSVNRTEKFFNSTHVLTREKVIKGYLLFNNGDTISDLTLSETERNLRQLSFINDARISVIPIDEYNAEILVVTRDDYSLGAGFSYSNPDKGDFSLFEKNIAGFAHELEIGVPYNLRNSVKAGLRVEYRINNIGRSFANMELFAIATPLFKSYGVSLERDFISAESDYAGAIRIEETFTYNDLDTLTTPLPVEYALQDYWIARSFMLNRSNLTRLILGARYINNNVYRKPEIDPMSYYSLQKYRLYLGSVSLSKQKFYKTSLIYNFGRTEDIPYGGLAVIVAGREFNEFKQRTYIGTSLSWGNSPSEIGYFNISASVAAFISKESSTEQGIADISLNYFTGLIGNGNWSGRGFVNARLTTGFDRYSDEYLTYGRSESVTGFRNDSIRGQKRLSINLESVVFSPVRLYGFRFVFFGFADLAFLGSANNSIIKDSPISGIGTGVRIRNDNLVINTLQIRIGYYPRLPQYSSADYFNLSGETQLRPRNFDAGPPSLIVYR